MVTFAAADNIPVTDAITLSPSLKFSELGYPGKENGPRSISV